MSTDSPNINVLETNVSDKSDSFDYSLFPVKEWLQTNTEPLFVNWPIRIEGSVYPDILSIPILNQLTTRYGRNGWKILLSSPFLISANEPVYHAKAIELARNYFHFPKSHQYNHDSNRFIVVIQVKPSSIESKSDFVDSSDEENMIFYWNWQTKLLFLILLIFTSPELMETILEDPEKSNPTFNPAKMTHRMNGKMISFANLFRLNDNNIYNGIPMTALVKNNTKWTAMIMNYADFNYRRHVNIEKANPDFLNKREILSFMITARWCIFYYYKADYIPEYAYLGIIRFMFSVTEYGTDPRHKFENFIASHYKNLKIIPESKLYKVLNWAWSTAMYINSYLKSEDYIIPVVGKERQRNLTSMLTDIFNNLNGLETSSYITSIKRYFNPSIPSPKPQLLIHATNCKFLSKDQLMGLLINNWECKLINELPKTILNDPDIRFLLIENHIAAPVNDYIKSICNWLDLKNCEMIKDIRDPYDPSKSNVLIVGNNKTLLVVQCIGWLLLLGQCPTYEWNRQSMDLDGVSVIFGCMTNQLGMFGLLLSLRILLTGKKLNELFKSTDEIIHMKAHSEFVKKLVDRHLFHILGDDEFGYYKKLLPIEKRKKNMTVFDLYYAGPPLNTVVQPKMFIFSTIASLLLYPYSMEVKIHKDNDEFMIKLLHYMNKKKDEKVRENVEKEMYTILSDAKFTGSKLIASSSVIVEEDYIDAKKEVISAIERLFKLSLQSEDAKLLPQAVFVVMLNCFSIKMEIEYNPLCFLLNSSSGAKLPFITNMVESSSISITFEKEPDDLMKMVALMLNLDVKSLELSESITGLPRTHILQQRFQNTFCLPEFHHNGEILQPWVTSFLYNQPHRNYKGFMIVNKEAELSNKSSVKSSRTNFSTLLPLNLDYDSEQEDESPSYYNPSSPSIKKRQRSSTPNDSYMMKDKFNEDMTKAAKKLSSSNR